MFASCLEALGINSILSISYKDNWGILRDSFVKWRKWKICGISHIVSISSLISSVKKLSCSPSFAFRSSFSFTRFLVLYDILPAFRSLPFTVVRSSGVIGRRASRRVESPSRNTTRRAYLWVVRATRLHQQSRRRHDGRADGRTANATTNRDLIVSKSPPTFLIVIGRLAPSSNPAAHLVHAHETLKQPWV